jgi:hypothetical protein
MLSNTPGTVAHVGEVLGNAGINIEGVAGTASGGQGQLNLCVRDAPVARAELNKKQIQTGAERDVEVIQMTDRPGELGRVMRHVANAGVNIDVLYVAMGNRLVIGSDNMTGLREALQSM